MQTQSAQPAIEHVHPENIPEELKAIPRFVMWRGIRRDNRLTKVPHQTSGEPASSTDEKTWTSFDAAVAALRTGEFSGLGFVLTGTDQLVGWDLDHCLDPKTLTPKPWAEKLVASLNSYTEITPSGEGLRILVRAAALPRPGAKNSQVGVECYGSMRYLTLTGAIWPGAPRTIEERSEQTTTAWREFFEGETGKASTDAEVKPFLRDERFNLLWKGQWQGLYPSQSEADLALCRFFARMTGNNEVIMDNLFRASGLMRKKWDSKRNDTTIGAMTIARAIEENDRGYEHTDLGNGARFAEVNSYRSRFCKLWDNWLIWDGTRWKRDYVNAVVALAEATIEHIRNEARAAKIKEARERAWKWAHRSQSRGAIGAMTYFGGAQQIVASLPEDFDRDPFLFNCANGTLDLRTGELSIPKQSDMISLRSEVAYDPAATAPRWIQFLSEITNGNTELTEYLQRAVGYSLTGLTNEQCYFFLYGSGQNGKSTFIDRILKIAGEYGRISQPEVLEESTGSQHPTAVASLDGARIVVIAETESGKRVRESRLKQLTGGDQITARKMRADEFTFTPKLKLWMHGNHKLGLRGTDTATWRRPHLIPFTLQIPDEKKDPLLSQALDAELPGILNWAVEGAREWFKSGLRPPEIVRAMTKEYRVEQDVIAEFLIEVIEEDPFTKWVSHAAVYRRYKSWAEANGDRAMTSNSLGRRLEEKGYSKVRGAGNALGWANVRLRMTDPERDGGFGGPREPGEEEM